MRKRKEISFMGEFLFEMEVRLTRTTDSDPENSFSLLNFLFTTVSLCTTTECYKSIIANERNYTKAFPHSNLFYFVGN